MVVRAVLAVLVLGVLAGAGLVFVLRPPPFEPPERGAVLADVVVVEPGRSRAEHQTIRVSDGRIVAIEPAGAGSTDEFAGSYVLPGLVDMHVHHPPDTLLGDVELFGLLFLAHGVTTVRDTGNFDGAVLASRRRVRRGESVGPRTFACGPILDGDPPVWPGSRVVATPEDGRAAVRELARDGVDCIKVYDHVERPVLDAIHDAAESAGLPVVGHVPRGIGFREARLDDVQHLTGVLEEGETELSESRLRSVITTSLVLDTAHTPTLTTWERTARLADYEQLRDDPAARVLPRSFRDVLWDPAHDPRFRHRTPEQWRSSREAPENARRVTRRLREAGVRLLLGTDTMVPFVFPGSSLHDEMREFEKVGFTPEEIWEMATVRAGEALREPLLGRIVPGAPADLLVFRADPTVDLSHLESLEAVVADGRLYRIADLREALARRRIHFEGAIVEAASLWVARRAAPS